MADRPRVVFIGLDSCDAQLVRRFCKEGSMPVVAELTRSGAWFDLDTTAQIMHVSAWPSIFTGAPPDHHGLYHAYTQPPGQHALARPKPEANPIPWFWKILDDAGRKCIVIDAFMTCPVQNFRGLQIVDWGTWTHFSDTCITPDHLSAEIHRTFGRYPAEDHSKVGMTPPPDPLGFHLRLLDGITKKTDLVTRLLSQETWELFLVVFSECHPSGHYFWHYQDSGHPAFRPDADPRLAGALREVYAKLDESIGRIRDTAGDEARLMLVSGDGMGPNHSGTHVLKKLLEVINTAASKQFPAAAANSNKGFSSSFQLSGLTTAVRGAIPKPIRAFFSRNLIPAGVNQRLSMYWKTANIDWTRTKAYLIDNANEAYVRINRAGREPQGIVKPDTEYVEFRDSLIEELGQLTNPDNKQSAVDAVFNIDDVFDGPYRDHMPDIVARWDENARTGTRLHSERHGLIETGTRADQVMPYYTGNHRPNAFMVYHSPEMGEIAADTAHILDLAPTLLSMFGVDQPEYMRGRTINRQTQADS